MAKPDAYRRPRADGGPDYLMLFWLSTRRRETHLHRHLAGAARSGVTVAKAARDSVDGHSPAGPVWRLVGNGRHRLTLGQLPSGHGGTGLRAGSAHTRVESAAPADSDGAVASQARRRISQQPPTETNDPTAITVDTPTAELTQVSARVP